MPFRGLELVAFLALCGGAHAAKKGGTGPLGPPAVAEPSRCGPDSEQLYNGICLPPQWPPRYTTPHGLPPRTGPRVPPPYIHSPPGVINVSLGRQLFVDPFLVDSMPGPSAPTAGPPSSASARAARPIILYCHVNATPRPAAATCNGATAARVLINAAPWRL